jgi:Mrp family chromosome partitioning ATPase
VSRGTNRSLAVRALDRLESTGARPMGVVFNRADSTDATYSSSSSHGSITSRRSSDAIVTRRPLEGSEKWKRMGPLVSAVALTMQHEPGETL